MIRFSHQDFISEIERTKRTLIINEFAMEEKNLTNRKAVYKFQKKNR